MPSYAQQFLSDIVIADPLASVVLERYGLDYCCHGGRTLESACREKGLDVEDLLRELEGRGQASPAASEANWSQETLGALMDHIVGVHHAFLRENLPVISAKLDKVCAAHGSRHPELHELRRVYGTFRCGLEAHMQKEEAVLFPMMRDLATGDLSSLHCGSVSNPIRQMEHEHTTAGAELLEMRRLTEDYTPPGDACPTLISLYATLDKLEHDLHLHVHEENNILYPRSVQCEALLMR